MRQLIIIFLLTFATIFDTVTAQQVSPVVFQGDTLFNITIGIGAFSAEARADMATQNINQLSRLPLSEFDSIKTMSMTSSTDVIHRQKVITSITQADADSLGVERNELAETYKLVIRQALIDDFNDTSIGNLGKDIGFFILALICFLVVFSLVNRLFDYLRKNLKTLERNIFFRNNRFIDFFRMITPETERSILLFFLRMSRFTILGVFLYFYLPFMFSQISYTRGFGERLMEYVLMPLQFLSTSFTGYLPKLLFILVIALAVRYLIRGLGHIAEQVRTEKLKLGGFFPDWAYPTFNLVRVLIIIFTMVIIFPYLPGAGSDAFQGISVFIGLLLSLGSAGAISNVISGVILTYMRPFKLGDRVKINDITGDVVSKNLLVTRIKTLKNEEITLPNATLLSAGIVNYSSHAHEHGLILHTGITIGYDVEWKLVHELLIEAALKTELINIEPAPFVLQKSLDDWYVAYELNAYTKESHRVPRIYSDLHANIQDVFNARGVEIMSSHYLALRDGNPMAVPKDYLGEDYQPPHFNIQNTSNK